MRHHEGLARVAMLAMAMGCGGQTDGLEQTPEGFEPERSQTCGATPPSTFPDDPTGGVNGIDRAALEAELAGEGLVGWIHGAVPAFGQYVFTYRAPGDFFSHVEMTMVPESDEVYQAQFLPLHRHDQVRVRGSFIDNQAPIGHLRVSAVEVIEAYAGGSPSPDYEASLPDDLVGADVVDGVVHAQAYDGGVIVLEYRGAILPVFVSERHRAAAAGLFRGDVIELRYTIQARPDRPTHIATDDSVDDAITVVDHLAWCNGQAATLEGELVRYPQSPQITMDVYALRHTDGNGMRRNWTLVNFDDPELFGAIQGKAAAAWAANLATAEPARNHEVNPTLKVTATGVMNVVSPSQANPQIILAGPDQLTIEVVP